MTEQAIALLKDLYLTPLQEAPEAYVGIELEFPIVNLAGKATDIAIAKDLMRHLLKRLDFKLEKEDRDGNPVQIVNPLGDRILFEVSYNTLEFAFARAKTIPEVEDRFTAYLADIQDFLGRHNHAIQGEGVHPCWSVNDNRAVSLPRYQMLLAYLALSGQQGDPRLHNYPQYGSFICGNQVQLDVSRSNYLRVINAFNKIEAAKAYLFANSEFDGEDWDTRIARDIFWEASMHGLLEENAGVNARDFQTDDDFLRHLGETALFTAEREGVVYYFAPIKAADYLKQETITAYSLDGEPAVLKPAPADFSWHRSYQYQDLTKRGTVEFRSVCTQPLAETFVPIAFHVGLLENLDQLEALLEASPFLEKYAHRYKELRRIFSRKKLTDEEEADIRNFSQSLLACAAEGLKKRGAGEERYLTHLSRYSDLNLG